MVQAKADALSVPSDPSWSVTFTLRRPENLSFHAEIEHHRPWISQIQSTAGLLSIFLRAQLW